MTAHTCRCGRPAPDATICTTCAGQLARDLGDVPAYTDELDIVLTRQSRYSDQAAVAGPAAAVALLPYNAAASEAGWVLRNTLVGWVRVLDEGGERWPANTVEDMSRWLLARVDELARHEAGDQAADELGAAVGQVRRIIDRPAGRIYAGPCVRECGSEGTGATLCGADLYAGPGHQAVVCGACGASYDLDERREWMLARLHDQLLTAAEVARALSALGEPVTSSMIRGYAARQRIVPHGVDSVGRPLYRVDDVIDVMARVAERRSA